jgi:type VI secretion system Hcp family effector
MASVYFLQLAGIDGMSGDKGHDKWIECVSFSHGSKQTSSIERGGDVAGRGQFVPFEFVHAVDKATPKLQEYCVTGKKIDKAVFQYSRVIAGASTPVYELTLENCRVMEAIVGTMAGSNDDDPLTKQPIETVKLVAGKMTWKVTPIKPDGTKDGAIEATFDQIANG